MSQSAAIHGTIFDETIGASHRNFKVRVRAGEKSQERFLRVVANPGNAAAIHAKIGDSISASGPLELDGRTPTIIVERFDLLTARPRAF